MNDVVRKHFDKLSSTYRRHFDARQTGANFSFSRRLELACELTGSLSGRLFDCAGGTGEITSALLKRGQFTEATVADISETMLANARSLIEAESQTLPIRFLCADVFTLKKSDVGEEADLIVCLGLIAHTGRLETLLTTLKALLTPRAGRILLQTTLAGHWGVAVTRAVSARYIAARTGYQLSYYRYRDICDVCKRVGLRVVDSRRHTVGIPFGDWIWARGNHWIESQFTRWADDHGAEALYLIADAE